MKKASLLKKKDGKFTDSYFQKEVVASTSRLYCIGTIKKGDYIATCPVYGAVMLSAIKETAIGMSLSDKSCYEIGEINAVLF